MTKYSLLQDKTVKTDTHLIELMATRTETVRVGKENIPNGFKTQSEVLTEPNLIPTKSQEVVKEGSNERHPVQNFDH